MRLSLFVFLHIVAIIILLVVHPHARAEQDKLTITDKYIKNTILVKRL